jgi:hypothetical protein
VGACQRAPARIYTDADIAKLEAQVMAKVAETDASCSKPELLDFAGALDDECGRACMDIDEVRRPKGSDVNVDSNEVAAVDEQCGAKVLAAFGRAAWASPGCSPFQIGVRAEPSGTEVPGVSGFMRQMHTNHIVVRHALREIDPYVGVTELLMGIRVYQDLSRGRIDLLQSSIAASNEESLVRAAEKILQRSSLAKEQLDDLAATLDTLIELEPHFSEMLQGEALSVALHMGVGLLKPLDWQPPGGRGELTLSNQGPARGQHDRRDDAAQLIAAELELSDRYARQCPPSATLAACYTAMPNENGPPTWDANATDKQAARVAMYPDDETRHDSQRQLVAMATQQPDLRMYIQKRAQMVARLVALRAHLQVLRDGKCPSDAQLREPPYWMLRAPGVLGDSLPITVKSDSIVIGVPNWMRDGKYTKFEPISIACP